MKAEEKRIVKDLIQAARPFIDRDYVTETSGTIPLMCALHCAIEKAEQMINGLRDGSIVVHRDGQADNLREYDRCLSLSEVRELYERELAIRFDGTPDFVTTEH